MNVPLLLTACVVALTCAMRYWQFNFGIRLYVYDLFVALFLLLFALDYVFTRRRIAISRPVATYIQILWLWVCVVAFSGTVAMLFPVGPESVLQFAKGFVATFVYALFLTAFVCFLARVSAQQRELIFHVFVAGAMLSCVYELLQMFFMLRYTVNLDAHIWDQISFNTVRDESEEFFGSDKWGVIPRGTGVAGGPNPQAVYLLTVLPLFLVNSIRARPRFSLLFLMFCMGALVATGSRSGAVAALVSFGVIALVDARQVARRVVPIMLIAIAVGVAIYQYWDLLVVVLTEKTFTDTYRIGLYQRVFDVFSRYPLGVGFNGLSVANDAYELGQANAHSSWLEHLVETGILGLSVRVALVSFVSYHAFVANTRVTHAFLASIAAICVAACFNETLDLFFVDVFIAVSFVKCVLDRAPEGVARRAVAPDIRGTSVASGTTL